MLFSKLSRNIFYVTAILALCGCDYLRNRNVLDIFNRPFEPTADEYIQNNRANGNDISTKPRSIIVCRSHQCAPAKLTMSKEFVYNSLLHLFDNNNYQKALVCQADPNSHTCLENFITLPITVGITPTNAYIDHVKISDVIIGKKADKINLLLNYNLTYGGQTPDCTPSKSILFAKNVNHVLIEDSGYTCKMTSIGQTAIKTVLAIDYIDLDYGYIGGYYSIGLSGPAYGGGNGYMILRLPKNAYPLDPSLQAPQKNPSKKGAPKNTSASAPSILDTNSSGNARTGDVQVFPIKKPEVE